jgi:hypothetical protein
MAEQEVTYGGKEADVKFTVVYKDVYSWGYFYKLLHEWLLDNKYCGADEDFKEILYEQLEKPFGTEIWLRWRLVKKGEAVGPYHELFQYSVDVDFHILGQKEVEVVTGGKKYKADKGEVEVGVAARVDIDPEKKIKNHWLGQHFEDFIFRTFLKRKVKQHKKLITYDMQRFQEAIKTYLKLETFLPERELAEYYQKRDQS